jgi:tetratricopeptide (TPR) repeat protein/predicted Ser/Thr protein kinase
MRCLDDDTIVGYLEGALAGTAAAAVEQHVAGCRQCRKLISAAVQAGPLPTEPLTPAEPPATSTPSIDVSPSAGSAVAGDDEPPPLRRGDALGRYVIRELLGTGGMSIVYLAHDPDLDREVAIKILRKRTPAAAGVLLREARVMARITHRNVVAIHDVGNHEGHAYIAMERVQGVTLAAWLRQASRSWREIVQVFLAAGHGLAAVHAAGVVHGDFKPDNVLIDHEGEVRVVDFGLARLRESAALDDDAASDADAHGPTAIERSSLIVTTAGSRLMGTPRFMAPEQFRGAAADPAAEQFSLCVALYLALYDQQPFAGTDLATLAREVTAGRLRPPPEQAQVPDALRAILWRGLALDPAARYPSLHALLSAIDRCVHPRRRRWIAAGAAVAAAAVAALVLAVGPAQTASITCEPADRALAGIWDRAHRDTIAAAFAATALPYAGDAFARVERQLDDYAARWQAMYDDACAAARASEDRGLPDLRVHCLDGRLQRLRALIVLYAAADAGTVERAVQAAEALPPVAWCASAEALRSAPLPPDPDQRAAALRVRDQIAHVASLYDTGKYTDGLAAAQTAATAALATAYRPVEAEALYHRGVFEHILGRYPEAEASLFQAASAAEAARYDRLAALAYIALFDLTSGEQLRFDDGKRWESLAAAVIERMGGDALLEMLLARRRGGVAIEHGALDQARTELERALALEQGREQPSQMQLSGIHTELGNVASRRAEHDQALHHYRQALSLIQAAVGPDYPDIAVLRNNMGIVLRSTGRYDEALDVLQQGLAVAERVFGAQHEILAALRTNIGATLSSLERHDESLVQLERAVAIAEAIHGRDHPRAGERMVNLGHELTVVGRYSDAVSVLERALAAAERWPGATPAYEPMARINLANALLGLGRHADARPHYERAADAAARSFSPHGPEVAEALLGLGRTHLAASAPELAIEPLERALAIHAQSPTEPLEHARTRFVLAQALWDSRRDRPRALRLAQEALAAYDAASGLRATERDQVATWLTRRAPRPR